MKHFSHTPSRGRGGGILFASMLMHWMWQKCGQGQDFRIALCMGPRSWGPWACSGAITRLSDVPKSSLGCIHKKTTSPVTVDGFFWPGDTFSPDCFPATSGQVCIGPGVRRSMVPWVHGPMPHVRHGVAWMGVHLNCLFPRHIPKVLRVGAFSPFFHRPVDGISFVIELWHGNSLMYRSIVRTMVP